MSSTIYIADDVLEFMTKGKQLTDRDDIGLPYLPELKLRVQRNVMLQEEIREYLEGEENHDIVAIADGLIDIVYVAIGTCLKYGIPFNAIWDAVHRANMSKLLPSPILSEMGKIMKPAGWKPADIKQILLDHGYKE